MPDREAVAAAVAAAATVEGWMQPTELEVLVELAAAVPGRCTIVEIGTYRGRSAVALALGASLGAGARVYTFDPHLAATGARGGTFGPADQAAKYANLDRLGVGDRVFAVGLDSKVAAAGWPAADVGLLLVDGDHREAAVRADMAAWEAHLIGAAVVVFDDADYPGVAAVIESLAASGQWEEAGRRRKLRWLRRRPGS